MTKSLNDVVDESDVIVGSEYMQTLLVVVPKSLYREWEKSYERLTEMVVPRCSKCVCVMYIRICLLVPPHGYGYYCIRLSYVRTIQFYLP